MPLVGTYCTNFIATTMITLGTVIDPKLLNQGNYNNIIKTHVIEICTFPFFLSFIHFVGMFNLECLNLLKTT